jgi:hypothetical protein
MRNAGYLRAVEEFSRYYNAPPDQLVRGRSGSIRPTCSRIESWMRLDLYGFGRKKNASIPGF